jgi:hypothetical protein
MTIYPPHRRKSMQAQTVLFRLPDTQFMLWATGFQCNRAVWHAILRDAHMRTVRILVGPSAIDNASVTRSCFIAVQVQCCCSQTRPVQATCRTLSASTSATQLAAHSRAAWRR